MRVEKKGPYYQKQSDRWMVNPWYNGRTHFCGTYKNKSAADKATKAFWERISKGEDVDSIREELRSECKKNQSAGIITRKIFDREYYIPGSPIFIDGAVQGWGLIKNVFDDKIIVINASGGQSSISIQNVESGEIVLKRGRL